MFISFCSFGYGEKLKLKGHNVYQVLISIIEVVIDKLKTSDYPFNKEKLVVIGICWSSNIVLSLLDTNLPIKLVNVHAHIFFQLDHNIIMIQNIP